MDLGGWTLLLLVVLYFAPLTLAVWRGHPRAMAIMGVSIAFGWTGVGWLIALVWSLSGPNYRHAPKTQDLDPRTQSLDDDGGQAGG